MNTFVKYFIVGVATVFIDFVLFYLFSTFGLNEIYANAISVLLSMLFNFFMQNYWSFKAGSDGFGNKTMRYTVISSLNYLINILLFFLLYKILLLEEYIYKLFPHFNSLIPDSLIVKCVVSGMIMCWNFFLFKNWVFKISREDNE